MTNRPKPAPDRRIGIGSQADLDRLLHPAGAFAHPMDVVNDTDLTVSEKRSILASWASDACAVEARNDLRRSGGATVRWDDIMDALRALDAQKAAIRRDPESGWSRWQRRRWQPSATQ